MSFLVFLQYLAQALAGSTQEAQHGRDLEIIYSSLVCKAESPPPYAYQTLECLWG